MLQTRQREEFDPKELSYAGIAMDALPVMCVSIVVIIMIFVDCGLWSFLQKKSGKSKSGGDNASTSLTQVLPVEESEVAVDRSGNKIVAGKQSDVDDADIVKNWGKQSSVNF